MNSDFSLSHANASPTGCFSSLTDIDATCSAFDNGTILHIAASNLCFDAAKCLVSVTLICYA